MRRIRLILTIAVAVVTMVLGFTVPAMAYGPGGLKGEGRTDIKEGKKFIAEGQALMAIGQTQLGAHLIAKGNGVIREGHQDVRRGQSGGFGH